MNRIEQASEVIRTEADALLNLIQKIDDNFTQAVTAILESTGRVIITGIGKSGHIGRKIAATMSSTGTRAVYMHPVEAMHGDLGMVDPRDVVIAISNSGETLELNHLIPSIKAMGCTVVAFTGNPHSALGTLADLVIDTGVEKEACPLGLAPTSSTTAQLAMGDALSVVLINAKGFQSDDFKKFHPGGALGQRLSLQVSEMMVTGEAVPLVSVSATVGETLAVLDAQRLGAVFVTDEEGILTGLLSDGDVRHLLAVKGCDMSRPVSEVMTESPRSVSTTAPAYDALNLMESHQITVLPATDEKGRVKGLLHLHDILGKGAFRFNGR
ncbi:KpsF/GutQ family sugar-phosphate isomerase [Desulfoluna sp.]|uniref:KpsF/GutQ family sugar-phosphate isomerase n=1 Tax=Desulfoluna sp. TaxID=2045199 RepID=UPI00260B9BFE|nr:KpsF/GutQ family sugar-phosphate isomerase [Desulfoluna sp.]